MLRIALLLCVVSAALAAVKHERVLERAGLLSSCSAILVPTDPAAVWQACSAGRLTGYPDLSRDSCTPQGIQQAVAYWRCPAPLATPARP